MSDPLFGGDDEANTPLTEEEREQLIPTYITTRAELNEAEQVNITRATRWLVRARHRRARRCLPARAAPADVW